VPWTREQLEAEWIGGSIETLGDRAPVALNAFDTVERHLGTEWLRAQWRGHQGPLPTLSIVLLGECLSAIEPLKGYGVLVEKIRTGDGSALAEMEAVRMFAGMGDVEIELAPELQVGVATKKPDFRVRRAGERWTYVEVTRPDTSIAARAAEALLHRFLDICTAVRRPFSMELFLRREPTLEEEASLHATAQSLAESDRFETIDAPGLALVVKEPFTGPVITPRNHPGEDNACPRFGAASGVLGGDGSEPQRMIAVRMPFSDERADDILKAEAKQLSKDEPGLIMIDMSGTRGGMANWVPLLRRRLQPTIHTRVSGICLFASGTELISTGVGLLFTYRTIDNPHAVHPLPRWILAGLTELARTDGAKRVAPTSQLEDSGEIQGPTADVPPDGGAPRV